MIIKIVTITKALRRRLNRQIHQSHLAQDAERIEHEEEVVAGPCEPRWRLVVDVDCWILLAGAAASNTATTVGTVLVEYASAIEQDGKVGVSDDFGDAPGEEHGWVCGRVSEGWERVDDGPDEEQAG